VSSNSTYTNFFQAHLLSEVLKNAVVLYNDNGDSSSPFVWPSRNFYFVYCDVSLYRTGISFSRISLDVF